MRAVLSMLPMLAALPLLPMLQMLRMLSMLNKFGARSGGRPLPISDRRSRRVGYARERA